MSLKKLFKQLNISGNNLASLVVSSFIVAAKSIRYFLSVPSLFISGYTTITQPVTRTNTMRLQRSDACYARARVISVRCI